MAQLEYNITGNNTSFITAINQAVSAIDTLQGRVDKLNATNLQGLISAFGAVTQTVNNFSGSVNTFNNSIQNGNRGLSLFGGQLGSVVTSYFGLFAVIAGVKKVISSNAEISDSLADIRRTASLTQPEVEALFDSLRKIDTRTSLKGLADITIIGGQLGIAKDQLAGFTKAVDQLSVSLSGELKGGPTEVAQSLGVLDKVFGVTAKNGGDIEKSFNQIGSVILGLGQSGLATGDFLASFAKRVGGVAAQAKLGLPTLLSYGAVLQEQGVTAEVAGSSFKKLVGSLATNRAAFLPIAQIADSTLTLKSFTDIINTDTQKALSLFFEGLAKGGTTTTAFSDLLKQVGLNAARSSQAITALALHQGDLNTHIQESNGQFASGTLAAQQFAIKNDTLGASVDKLGKAFVNLTTNGSIGGLFKTIIDGAAGALNAISSLTQSASWGEFFLRLSQPFGKGTKNAIDLQYNLRAVFEKGPGLISDFNTLNNPLGAAQSFVVSALADKSATELKALITKYQQATQQAAQGLNTYKASVANGTLTDSGPFTIAAATKNYLGLKKILDTVSAAYVQVRDASGASSAAVIKSSGEVADAELKTVKAINARILELKNDALSTPANADVDIQRIDALRARLAQFNAPKAPKSTGVFDNISASLTDILNRTNALSSESGLKGYDLKVQQIKDTYIKLNAEIDANQVKLNRVIASGNLTPKAQAKATADQGQINTDRAAVTAAQAKELADAKITEAQRVADEIQRINDEFGIKSETSRSKELASIQARYDAEKKKAQNNADILKTLDADRLIAVQAINDKYALIEQDLQDKIAAIQNQAIADITGKDESQTQKIQNEWDKRIQSADKYYDELIKINGSAPKAADDPFGFNKAIKNLQLLSDKSTTERLGGNATNVDITKSLAAPLTSALNSSVQSFGQSFITELSTVSTYTTGTFDSIFASLVSKLTTSLNGFFVTTFTQMITKALTNAIGTSSSSSIFKASGGLTTTGLLAAGAGIAGGIVSAATPATSTLGQAAGGALSGAGTGALIGSVIPGLGTVAGAVIGGVVGAIGGIFGAASAQKKAADLQQQQLDQAKAQTQLQKAQLDAYTSSIIGRMTAQGNITNLSVGATGQLVATVSGKDIQFVLDRNAKTR